MEQQAKKDVDLNDVAYVFAGANIIGKHFPELHKPIADMIGAAILRHAGKEPPIVMDFRTVAPDTKDEDQLQRVFQVMQGGGKEWDTLEKAIELCWTDFVRKEA